MRTHLIGPRWLLCGTQTEIYTRLSHCYQVPEKPQNTKVCFECLKTELVLYALFNRERSGVEGGVAQYDLRFWFWAMKMLIDYGQCFSFVESFLDSANKKHGVKTV